MKRAELGGIEESIAPEAADRQEVPVVVVPDADAELERDLWILMAEVATADGNRAKLEDGRTRVSQAMVDAIETRIDYWSNQVEMPKEFVVPGENQASAALDVARTIVRRAERIAVAWSVADSLVVSYLNRLSDLVWTLARVAEGPQHRTARSMKETPNA